MFKADFPDTGDSSRSSSISGCSDTQICRLDYQEDDGSSIDSRLDSEPGMESESDESASNCDCPSSENEENDEENFEVDLHGGNQHPVQDILHGGDGGDPPPDDDGGSNHSSSSDSDVAGPNPDGGDGGDPPPDDDGTSNNSSSSESDEENFNLDHQALNRLVRVAENRTVREILAMILALAVRQNLDYKTIVAICRIVNAISEAIILPATKKQLWKFLQRNAAGITRHAFCSDCLSYRGILDNLPRIVQCNNGICPVERPRGKWKRFICLKFTKRVTNFLSTTNIWERVLQYRATRQKYNPDALEDIMDGEGYRALQNMENGLQAPNDFSYIIDTDGFTTSKSSTTQAIPIFIKLNEIPPALRQKTTMLVGIIVDDQEPDWNMFFEEFVNEANILSTEGITWQPHPNGERIVSRFFPTCFCADSKARASVMNHAHHMGTKGCTFCEHPGIKLMGSMKYPLPGTEIVVRRRNRDVRITIPLEIPLRTDASIKANMVEAERTGRRVQGVKGASVLMRLNKFNLGYGFSTDDLHPIYLGATKFLTKLIFQSVVNVKALERNIDQRLLHIRTPTHISRKPRSITKRAKYKGSEWEHWLQHYGVPCMKGLVRDDLVRLFGLLSKGTFLLSRDSVSADDVHEAERCYQEFVTTFQRTFGPENMRFNIHVLLHVPNSVRFWGPLNFQSTYSFESLNGRYGKFVHSPKGADDQIVDHHLLDSLVNKFTYDPEISEEIKEEIDFILTGSEMINPLRVGSALLFGNHSRRAPLREEIHLLAERNLQCDEITIYDQCKVKNTMLVQSAQYYQRAVEDPKSDNSVIYTSEDEFFSVDYIVTFREGDRLECGMFCHHIAVGDRLFNVDHIMSVTNMEERQYVPIQLLRNMAMKIHLPMLNEMYVTPMANQSEID